MRVVAAWMVARAAGRRRSGAYGGCAGAAAMRAAVVGRLMVRGACHGATRRRDGGSGGGTDGGEGGGVTGGVGGVGEGRRAGDSMENALEAGRSTARPEGVGKRKERCAAGSIEPAAHRDGQGGSPHRQWQQLPHARSPTMRV